MIYYIIYFIVAILATTIGAIVGLGGGILMKPIFTAIEIHDVVNISILVSLTILFMTLISVTKHLKRGTKLISKTSITITIGSIIGGYLGSSFFNYLTKNIDKSEIIKVQSLIFIIMLLIVLVCNIFIDRIKKFNIDNLIMIFILGIFLGSLASFLGVGGGPLNMLLFMILFSWDYKKAAIHSLFIKLFSQSVKVIIYFITYGISQLDYTYLFVLIPAGILGGFIGTSIHVKLDTKSVKKIFYIVIIFGILINVFQYINI